MQLGHTHLELLDNTCDLDIQMDSKIKINVLPRAYVCTQNTPIHIKDLSYCIKSVNVRLSY